MLGSVRGRSKDQLLNKTVYKPGYKVCGLQKPDGSGYCLAYYSAQLIKLSMPPEAATT